MAGDTGHPLAPEDVNLAELGRRMGLTRSWAMPSPLLYAAIKVRKILDRTHVPE